jgi:hypothetical protein
VDILRTAFAILEWIRYLDAFTAVAVDFAMPILSGIVGALLTSAR